MRGKQRSGRRIFVVTPFENRMAQRGTRLPVMAEMLVDAGHEVEYVTTNFSHAYKHHFTRAQVERQQAAERYRLTVLPVLGYRRNISVRRVISNVLMALRHFVYLLRAMRNGDVMLVPSRPVELVACAAALRRLKGIRVVMDIRDIWPDALVIADGPKKRVFTAYCNLLLGWSLKRMDRFVHIAPSFVHWLHRYAPDRESEFLPPGFDAGRWAEFRPMEGEPGAPLSIVCVGALQYQIDVMPILEAVRGREDCRLTIIGDSPEDQRHEEVTRYIARHRMGNVELAGRLSPEAVVRRMEGHTVGVVPMISSSITNKMFDYIAAGMPVLSLGDNDSSDFVRRHGIGWTAPFDGAEVGRLLDRLTPEEFLQAAERVRRIRNSYDRDTLYRRFIRIVEEA